VNDDDQIRSYIDHLVAEHRRLHGVLRHLRKSLVYAVGPDEAPSFADTVRILVSLRDELARHFAQEEAGGCLDEAVSHRPQLSSEARRIEAEHPELLAEIDRLISQARQIEPTPVNQFALQREFERLFDRISAHEKSETELLRQGFGTNFDDQPGSRSTPIHEI
jgi:hypothetical protein